MPGDESMPQVPSEVPSYAVVALSDQAPLEETPLSDTPLADALRDRALALSSRTIVVQGVAAVALSGAMALFRPERLSVAVLVGATVSMHALWSLAVQRTAADAPIAPAWHRLRLTAALLGTGSALALLFTSALALLGHLQS
jgi:uncharacterized membrane protein YraQ (UPF0718 family)